MEKMETLKVVVDTDIIIDYLKKRQLSIIPLQARDWTLESRMPLLPVFAKLINFLSLHEMSNTLTVYQT